MRFSVAMLLAVLGFITTGVPAQAVNSPPAADAETAEVETPPPLRVATKIAEPFVIQLDDGSLEGISIALWKRVAEQLGREFTFEVMTLDELLSGVADGSYDAGIAAISITPEREEALDMSHGYITT
ncbi:MAG: transporter substrate-binding domain-containing protein, partial [Phycisphaerales bacterium]|nr:transporter substrate-binding domain-containing protein [Phycisphaerales bacterium]